MVVLEGGAVSYERGNPVGPARFPLSGGDEGQHAPELGQQRVRNVTQGQILSQSPTDATRFWWHLYGS